MHSGHNSNNNRLGLVVPPPVDTMVTALQPGSAPHQSSTIEGRPSTPPARRLGDSSGTEWISFQNFINARSKELRVHHLSMDGRAGSLSSINRPRPSSSSCQHFRFSTLGTILEESDRICLHGLRNLQPGSRDGGHRVYHLWLRCYSHVVRKYMLTRTGCYLSTAGMLMMLGHHDVNVANQSDLGRIKKMITNPLACRIIDAPSGPRDHDMLAGDFRAGTTILITDLMFRVGTQSGTHGIQMGLADMGWESVEVFKIHDSEAERPLQQFLDTLDKVKQYLSTDTVDDGFDNCAPLVVIAVPTCTKTTSLCHA